VDRRWRSLVALIEFTGRPRSICRAPAQEIGPHFGCPHASVRSRASDGIDAETLEQWATVMARQSAG